MVGQDVRSHSKIACVHDWDKNTKNYHLFMIPKAFLRRLLINMESNPQSPNANLQTWPQPEIGAAFGKYFKESQLKLSLETRNRGDIMIVYCHGRIVYRDEAAALSCLVGEILTGQGKVILDLSGVSSIDSAGIGELAFLQSLAQSQHADLKCASPSPWVRDLLDLTNLDSVLEIHPSVCDALAAFHPGTVYADC
jgi:anti-anti-sigma factor